MPHLQVTRLLFELLCSQRNVLPPLATEQQGCAKKSRRWETFQTLRVFFKMTRSCNDSLVKSFCCFHRGG